MIAGEAQSHATFIFFFIFKNSSNWACNLDRDCGLEPFLLTVGFVGLGDVMILRLQLEHR